MAKNITIKDATLAERLKLIDAQLDVINKDAGIKEGDQPIAFRADDSAAQGKLKTEYIQTPCMELNEQISGKPGIGGFPIGSATFITGRSDSGKTHLILETIGLQMAKDPNFIVLWIESEQSLVEDSLEMFHIDPQRFVLIYASARDGGEQILDRAESLLNTGAFKMFVINSLKALTPKSIIDKPVSEDTMAAHARMNSKFMAKFGPLFSGLHIAAVVVQHLASSMQPMSRDPFVMTGGEQIKYRNMLQLDLRKQSIGEGDPIGKEEGMKITVYVRKNHLNSTQYPYVKITYYVIYGQGIETKLALLQRGLDRGVLTKAGAYIKFVDKTTGEVLSWQGRQAFRNALSDPDLYAKIEAACGGLEEALTPEEIEEFETDEVTAETKPARKGRKKKAEEPADATE